MPDDDLVRVTEMDSAPIFATRSEPGPPWVPRDQPPLTADEVVEALSENPRPIFGRVGTAGGVHISDGPFQVYESPQLDDLASLRRTAQQLRADRNLGPVMELEAIIRKRESEPERGSDA